MAPEAIAKMATDRWFEVVRYVYSFAPRINTNNSKKMQIPLPDHSKTEYPPPSARESLQIMLANFVAQSAMLFTSALACIPRKDLVSNCADRPWPFNSHRWEPVLSRRPVLTNGKRSRSSNTANLPWESQPLSGRKFQGTKNWELRKPWWRRQQQRHKFA